MPLILLLCIISHFVFSPSHPAKPMHGWREILLGAKEETNSGDEEGIPCPFILKVNQIKDMEGQGLFQALTVSFTSFLDLLLHSTISFHFLLVDHCYRWQLYTSLKFTQTIRWPMSLSQNRLCRFLLREACPNYLSDVALIFLSLQVLLLVGTDEVTNFQWWGEH